MMAALVPDKRPARAQRRHGCYLTLSSATESRYDHPRERVLRFARVSLPDLAPAPAGVFFSCRRSPDPSEPGREAGLNAGGVRMATWWIIVVVTVIRMGGHLEGALVPGWASVQS
jgi:hypothetical protein